MAGESSRKGKSAQGQAGSVDCGPKPAAQASDLPKGNNSGNGAVPLAARALIDELEVQLLMRADRVDALELLALLAATSSWLTKKLQRQSVDLGCLAAADVGFDEAESEGTA
jgi:hypothetical protein